ncbi:tRNA (N6-threonylcarbamoyladenosine(37)-N6)-methyltransferase TrmO [Calditrichota bacterium]
MIQISYKPIGIIHSPFKKIEGMPIQPSAANGIKGHIVVREEYAEGLKDLDGFSHIHLLYHLHLSKSYKLKVIPFLDNQERGVFSTRAPKRPNPIGLSVVKLINIKINILEIENVDIVDGTPLLDIKPYVGGMEAVSDHKIGWLLKYKKEMKSKKSDNRFK